MNKEELEKSTGQELIEQRDYCGVDSYYGDCLNDVNAEMLKRFNRLVDIEKENAELKEKLEVLEKLRDYWKGSAFDWRHKFFEKRSTKRLVKKSKQLAKARDLILNLYNAGRDVLMCRNEELVYTRLDNAINDKRIEQFLKEVSE